MATISKEHDKNTDLTRFALAYVVDKRVYSNGDTTIVSFGRSRLTNKKVIVKCLQATEYQKLREANILKKLINVPGVITFLDRYYFTSTKQIMVTEYFGDCNLARFIHRYAPVSENTTHKIITQLVNAAQACYNLHILHRKIRPSNILINTKTLQVKLHNFDTACSFDDDFFDAPLWPNIAPPEYLTTKTYTADGHYVWTIGLILYELLFNTKPFESTESIITKSCLASTRKPIDINALVLVGWMLNKNPLQRIHLWEIPNHPWISKKWI
jgi:hypothetical protein